MVPCVTFSSSDREDNFFSSLDVFSSMNFNIGHG